MVLLHVLGIPGGGSYPKGLSRTRGDGCLSRWVVPTVLVVKKLKVKRSMAKDEAEARVRKRKIG